MADDHEVELRVTVPDDPVFVSTDRGKLTQIVTNVVGNAAVDPVLPPGCRTSRSRVCVGGARIDIRFWRDAAGDSHYEVLRQEGTLRILRQPPVDSLSAGIWDRLGALARGMPPFR